MIDFADTFDHEHRDCELLFGRGRVADLGDRLAAEGLDRALVVCGANVGANDDLMDPIREGLGDHHAGTFDGTTPGKRIEEATAALEAAREVDADVLVGVGGGSSLDVARQAPLLAADDRSVAALRKEATESGSVAGLSAEPDLATVVIPTTFAGADVSTGGSLELFAADDSPTGQPVTVSGSAWPVFDVLDPALFETTPTSVLAGSAMNGFNKGIETPYAADANPASDAPAIHGLRFLADALPKVAGDGGDGGDGDGDDTEATPEAMERAVAGIALVQLDRKVSVVHAFGHGFARRYDVQQGDVHAVVVPHVLAYLFEEVDAARTALAEGLGVDHAGRDDEAVAADVVAAVRDVRDALDVPRRARDLPEADADDIPDIAAFIADDPPMERAPAGLDGSAERIEAVLREAW
ncbi:iron-containing alcohol dehydrogenase family protein [Halorubrum gandharaense]